MRTFYLMNDRDYWERVGKTYDEQVFDVFAADRGRVIAARVEKMADKSVEAADFGCGVGKFLPLLSRCFKRVRALDFSISCLVDGRRRHASLSNVSFHQFDLCSDERGIPPVGFGISVNALLTPDFGEQLAMFQSLARHIRRKGTLLLVVPSIESAQFVADRYLQWNVRSGMTPARAMKAACSSVRSRELNIAAHGVVEIGGSATKHHLREELTDRLSGVGFSVEEIVKVEYGWQTEFNDPPRWMKAPYPWDWCVVATRR